MASITEIKEGDRKTEEDTAKANEEAVKKEVERISKLEQSYREILKTKEQAYTDYVRATEASLKLTESYAAKESKQRTEYEREEVAAAKKEREDKFHKHNNALEDSFRSLAELFGAKITFYEQIINNQNARLKEFEDQKKA
jgi:hypothetical protein